LKVNPSLEFKSFEGLQLPKHYDKKLTLEINKREGTNMSTVPVEETNND